MYSIHWESTFLSYWWNDILKVTRIIYQKSKVVLKGIVWVMWVVILIGKENLQERKSRKFTVDATKSPLHGSGLVGLFVFFVAKLVFFVQIILSACE